MNQLNIKTQAWWIPLLLLFATSCESFGAEGNLGVGMVAGIIVAILLGWGAFKLLGGMLKIGIWGTVILVIIVIGAIAYLIFQLMGS